MKQPTVVVVGRDTASLGVEREILSAAGVEVEGIPLDDVASQLPDVVRNAEGILHSSWQIDRSVIERLEHCRVIGRYRLGYDNIDVRTATEHGIAVVTARGYCEEEISDHVLAFMLGWYRRIPFYDRLVRAGKYRALSQPIPRISTLTAGLCGLGGIARCLAPKMKALGMRVISYDPYTPDQTFTSLGITRVHFDELLEHSDVISIHCALTEETHHLFDARALQKMKRSAILINTARGGVIDTEALVGALRHGGLAGACLDVLEKDAFESYALHEIESILLTPHVSWRSETARVELLRRAATNVRLVLEGKRPEGLVNSEVVTALNLVG